jgi:hypothetical protein
MGVLRWSPMGVTIYMMVLDMLAMLEVLALIALRACIVDILTSCQDPSVNLSNGVS